MNDSPFDRVLRVLFRAGRAAPAEAGRAALGFETRLMATLRLRRESGEMSPWVIWGRLTWRLVPVLGAVVIALGAWSWVGGGAGERTTAAAALEADPLGFEVALVDTLTSGGL